MEATAALPAEMRPFLVPTSYSAGSTLPPVSFSANRQSRNLFEIVAGKSALNEPAKITATTPNRKRKSMSTRSGQSGTVVLKGQMWHGRYYADAHGQSERRRASAPIGPVKELTKTEAKRKLRTMLEQMGLNADDHLVRLETNVKTFASVAAWWRENKMSVFKPSSQENMGDQIDRYLIPRFGALTMTAITEERVQEFIAALSRMQYTRIRKGGKQEKKLLSPKSVRNIVGLLKQILGKKHCSTWELRFPEVPIKEQRYLTTDEMRQVVNAARGQWKTLWATLAGTGMRISEAIGLHVEDVNLKAGSVIIRRSDWKGQEITPKSKRGYRVASIDPVLVEMLKAHIGKRSSGRLFSTRKRTPLGRRNVNRNLYGTLKKLGIPKAGPHAFRHGRVSVLAANGVPQKLQEEWVGHSSYRITERYTHFDDTYRQKMVSESALFSADSPNGPNSEGVLEPVRVAA
jgi:integrase